VCVRDATDKAGRDSALGPRGHAARAESVQASISVDDARGENWRGAVVIIRRSVVVFLLLMSVVLSARELTPTEQQVLTFIDQRREAAIDLLARSVNTACAYFINMNR